MKGRNIFTKLSVLFFVSTFFLLVSCQSTYFIPGKKTVVYKNISAEYFNIAQGYEGLKNYNKAIEYYKLAMNDKSIANSCNYKIGRCYALSKDYSNAAKIYESLVAKDPDNLSLKMSLAYVYAMGGETNKAIAFYKNLAEKYPEDVSVLVNYTALLISDSKYELAEKNFYILKEKFPADKSIVEIQSKLADYLENPEKFETKDTSEKANK